MPVKSESGFENDNMVVVYHGSTVAFDEIDVTRGKPYKDFGRGFYVTRVWSHAESLAVRNREFEIRRFGRSCSAYIHTFLLDLDRAMKELKFFEFKKADVEWMRFVLANRDTRARAHDFQMIVGPTANDDTSAVLKAYFGGFYGDVGSTHAIETALRFIEGDNLPPQIYFADNRVRDFLRRDGEVTEV